MIWKITRRKHNVVFVFGKQAKVLREMQMSLSSIC